ncbi:hypothetical protein ZIOFF_072213 [Zingiber officinale]|uniref:Uncharacterized protein n=1 Tax=Zingiber officinale TaxID=94328 RepID=A0A8J5BFE3_ZINOF|nr:hypothetical protein ZIOFF_072213 [Zingiber officinale]
MSCLLHLVSSKELRGTRSPPYSKLYLINWNPAYCKSMKIRLSWSTLLARTCFLSNNLVHHIERFVLSDLSSFLETDQPPSVILLHHLYSRAPDELQSPLQSNQLTPKNYSMWLDDSHGEDQIWKGIKATLDDYQRKVRARGDKEFSLVYSLMLQIGSSLAENTSQ